MDVRHYSMLILAGTDGQLVFEELVERRSVPICIEAYDNIILNHEDEDDENTNVEKCHPQVGKEEEKEEGEGGVLDPRPHHIQAYHIPKPAQEIAFLPSGRGIEEVPWVVVTSQSGLARLDVKNPNLGGKYVERIKYTWSPPNYNNNNSGSGSPLTPQGMTVSTVNDKTTTTTKQHQQQQLYSDFLYGCFTKYLELIDFDTVTVVRGFLTSSFINEIDLSGLRNVTSASMLLGCQHLTSIDLSPMTKLTTITGLCSGCSSLSTVNLRGLENVTTIGGQFLSSTAITSIDLSPLRSVRSIGVQFLAWCNDLSVVVGLELFARRKHTNDNLLNGDEDEEDAVVLGDNFMSYCASLNLEVFGVLSGRKEIPANIKVELGKLEQC